MIHALRRFGSRARQKRCTAPRAPFMEWRECQSALRAWFIGRAGHHSSAASSSAGTPGWRVEQLVELAVHDLRQLVEREIDTVVRTRHCGV